MATATLKFIRLSSTKARLIAREVQGMNVELALASLQFMPNKAAHILSKVIASATANAGLEANEAVIKSCRVDRGPSLKRFKPRARGSASGIRKPTSHVFVEVDSANSKATPKPAKAAPKKAVAKTTKPASDKKSDDLTKIAGIGKVYAGKLNDEGIFTYNDVVNMTQKQIDVMEEKYTFKGDFKDSIEDAKQFVNGKDK
ncbi:MAG: LSU ribosomal protein L22p (L17e) [uncultured Campylobacterales bacterium]|uniref:Large ribosomal subunit protein uL22 n=1 Tax=uncultured Campylobacterales bacterium TaxID=352960 RepID=A0A6S6SC87_9BACT|nr:MAG: LSU ribosomal protein L22p (L17e) [uncultured Campylobacterales bacterium]